MSKKKSCFARFIEWIKNLFCCKKILFGADKIIVLTQEEYNAIDTPDENVLYCIK